MNILGIVFFSCFSVITIVLLRQANKEIATVVLIGCGTILLLSLLDELFDVVYSFYNLSLIAGIDSSLLSIVVKIIGVGYLSEFCASLCEDANCKSLGEKVLFGGKISITLLALPLIVDLVQIVLAVLP